MGGREGGGRVEGRWEGGRDVGGWEGWMGDVGRERGGGREGGGRDMVPHTNTHLYG